MRRPTTQQPPGPYPEPVLYPQLLRTSTYAGWRPLVGVVVLLITVFAVASWVLALVVLLPATAVQALIEGMAFNASLSAAADTDKLTPATMLWLNLTLGSGTLVAWAVVRWLHGLRPRWLTSVRPGMRWGFFWACLPISVAALALQLVLSSVLPAGDRVAGAASGSAHHLGGQALAFLLVILVTTPLQTTAEEYVFRGYLLQAVGSIFRRWTPLARVVTVVVPALAFAAAHGSQNFPLFFDRLAFGLVAGYLVIRVGGLEAGFALHLVNNFFAYGAALLLGNITTVLATTSTSYWQVPVTIVQSLFYLAAVTWLAKRSGISARTAAASPAAPSASAGAPGGERRTPIGDDSA